MRRPFRFGVFGERAMPVDDVRISALTYRRIEVRVRQSAIPAKPEPAMVVVASLIGAKGLGEDVLEALQYASVGQGILSGFSILFLARGSTVT